MTTDLERAREALANAINRGDRVLLMVHLRAALARVDELEAEAEERPPAADARLLAMANRALGERIDALEAELFEARAMQWALDEAGAYTGVKPPEVEGWSMDRDRLTRRWGSAHEECGPLEAQITSLAGRKSPPYSWWLLEGDGDGYLIDVKPGEAWEADHPWDGPASGEADTLRQAVADAEAAVESRLAWQVEEGRRIRESEAPDAV